MYENEDIILGKLRTNREALENIVHKTAVDNAHVFADTTARDAYFVTNPTELVENLFISVGSGFQQYLSEAWVDKTAIITGLPMETLHYYVGVNQKYHTIVSALNDWKAAGKPKSVVHIMAGVYNEHFYEGGTSDISFIGEGKEVVTWKTTTGYYDNCPLVIGGNVLIKGITFIADTSDNPEYVYAAYTGAGTGAAYGLHIDDTTAVGEVVVEDCDIISYVNAALGSGTRINQQIRLLNCRLFSYSSITATKTNGALLYHTSSVAGATNQKFTAKGCYFYSANDLALNIQSYGDNTLVPLDFTFNTLMSGTLPNLSLITFSYSSGATMIKTYITENSCGNNTEALNDSDSSWQKALLTKLNGVCLSVTDFNSAQYGYFMGNGASGCSNTPTAAWHIGMAIKYAEGGNPYIVQYSWTMVSAMKKYKRNCINNVWGSWVECTEINTEITTLVRSVLLNISSSGYTNNIADANNADRCGYYYSATNTPTAANYNIHHVSNDINNAVQTAYLIGAGTAYRRVKNAGVWGSWTAI